MSIVIKGGYIVAFDGLEHRLLKDGVVVIEDDRIKHVGKTYSGDVDETIDARGKLVSPGFINTHLHFSLACFKSWHEDVGSRNFDFINDPEFFPTFLGGVTAEDRRLFARRSIVECLKSGNTTITEFSRVDRLEEETKWLGEMGIRAYLGARVAACLASAVEGKDIRYKWDNDKALKDLERATDFVKEYDGVYDGRIKGMYTPGDSTQMTVELYQEVRRRADEFPAPINVHVAYSLLEFQECIRRYGMTPIEWLESSGLLKDDVIIGHGFMITGHSNTLHSWGDDLGILAKHGCTVSNHPFTFALEGKLYEAYSDYLQRGINCTLGTDIPPYDIIREMRWAAILNKCVKHDSYVGTAGDVYSSVTLAGAKALKRPDLGRIAPGAKADLAIINLKSLHMSPVRDPIKNLVYYGHTTDVDTTFVDGKKLVEGGKFLGLDEDKLIEETQRITMRIFDQVPKYDWAHRTADQMAPQTIKPWTE